MSGLGAAFTGFRLLGIGKMLSGIPWQVWAALGTIAALLIGWHVIAVRERHAWNAGYNVAWAHEQRTIAAVRVAAAKATRDQIAANAQPAVLSKAIAEKSDAESQAYYERGRRAGLDYAAAHLVRASAAPVGSPGRASDLPATDRPAEKHDSPGDAADMVAVSRADFDTLVGNSTRLAQVHQDAEQLIAAGIAAAQ